MTKTDQKEKKSNLKKEIIQNIKQTRTNTIIMTKFIS